MTRWTLFTTLLLAAACANDRTGQKGDTLSAAQPPAPATAATPAPGASSAEPRGPNLEMSPRGGPAGTKVTLSISGLVLHAKVDVGFGGFAEHEILVHDTASVDGEYKGTVTVPAATRPGTYYFFLADTDTGSPFGRPMAFVVTAKDGTVTLSGKLEQGVECLALRSDTDELYTLAGASSAPPAGSEVVVQGTLAQTSTCQQGITIAVKSIRPK